MPGNEPTPRFCPNCSAEVGDGAAECWNCRATFGAGSVWAPVDKPPGRFQKWERPAEKMVEVLPQGPINAWERQAGRGALIPARLWSYLLILPLFFALPILLVAISTGGKAALGIMLFWPVAYLIAASYCYAVSLLILLPVIMALRLVGKLRFEYYISAAALAFYLLSGWFVAQRSPFEPSSPTAHFWGFFAFWMVYAVAMWAGAPPRSFEKSREGMSLGRLVQIWWHHLWNMRNAFTANDSRRWVSDNRRSLVVTFLSICLIALLVTAGLLWRATRDASIAPLGL